MSLYLQIISSSSDDSYPSLLLCYEQNKYLFNAGEGFQRIFSEHTRQICRKIQCILLSQINWNCAGGLPGIILTISKSDKGTVKTYGPPGLQSFLDATGHFLNRPEFKVAHKECVRSENVSNNGQFVIKAVPVTAAEKMNTGKENETVKRPHTCVVYFCHTPEVQGQFLVERAKELNIPPGPLYGELKSGKPVTLPDGRVIEPEEVVLPSSPAMVLAVVDGLSAEHCKAIFQLSEWDALYAKNFPEMDPEESGSQQSRGKKRKKGETVPPVLKCIVHLTPLKLCEHHEYQCWMRRFGSDVTHIFAGKGCGDSHASSRLYRYSPLRKSHLHTCKLAFLFPEVFPHLYSETFEEEYHRLNEESRAKSKQHDPVIVYAEPGLRYNFIPFRLIGVDRSNVLGPLSLQLIEEMKEKMEEKGFGGCVLDKEGFIKAMEEKMQASVICEPASDVLAGAAREPSDSHTGTTSAKDKVKGADTVDSEGLVETMKNSANGERALEALVRAAGQPLDTHIGAASAKDKVEQANATVGEVLADEASLLSEETKARAREHIQLLRCPEVAGCELAFLGTGAAVPSQYRNVTGIYLQPRPNSDAGMLIDCGESTLGNFLRLYGPEEGYRRLQALKLVWISHLHPDHHLGLIRVLTERKAITTSQLIVICSYAVERWLADYSRVDSSIFGTYRTVRSSCFVPDKSSSSTSRDLCLLHLKELLGLTSLKNVPVHHCSESYGLVIESEAGWKLVYSGDCRPSHNLIRHGINATVLIHEATFDDAMHQDALEKKHCTISEAMSVATKMGAFRVFLSHFSARYIKFPILPEQESTKVCIAFDFMRAKFSDLLWMPAMLPILQKVFPSDADEGEVEGNDIDNCSGPPLPDLS